MKFFKFLMVAFPVYMLIALISFFILSAEIRTPHILEIILQIISASVFFIAIPFRPILESTGMWVTAFWSSATTEGVILSAVVWEIIFIIPYLILKARSRRLTIQS